MFLSLQDSLVNTVMLTVSLKQVMNKEIWKQKLSGSLAKDSHWKKISRLIFDLRSHIHTAQPHFDIFKLVHHCRIPIISQEL